MKRPAYLCLAVLVLLSASGCSMKEATSKISFELRRVQVTHMDDRGFDATLYMQVNNPNRFGMTVSDFRYRAIVSGVEVARGATESEIDIPSRGSAVAELPIEVTYGGLKDRLPDIIRGKLGYRVTGEVGFKTWFGRHAVKFDTEKKPEGERKKKGRKGKRKEKDVPQGRPEYGNTI